MKGAAHTGRWSGRLAWLLGGWLLTSLFAAPTVEAQYFGRNKVKYEDFDFRVLETEHFQVYFYEREREAATEAARMAERWYARLSELFRHELTGKQPLILYASHPEFAQTTAIPGAIGQGTGGVTSALKRRIVLPMAGTWEETNHVIGHELVHAFQYDLAGVTPSRPLFGTPAVAYLPLWVMEGLAEYYSVGPRSALTAMWLRDGLSHERLPSVDDLWDTQEFFPYRWGHAFWAFVGGRWGAETPWAVFRAAVLRRNPRAALDSVLGVRPDTLAQLWHQAIVGQYGPLRDRTTPGEQIATPLVTEAEDGSELNVGPAISPDGRWMLFLSSRDPFAIDLYLADAETGEVLRRLTRSALDAHYQSLQFVNSAGAWAPDNERIAFAAVSDGQPTLVIMEASSGRRLRTYRLDRFGAIHNPTWSPDGHRVAFIGNESGWDDLWILDLESEALRQLTEGSAAELHPDWSPDGRWIAITTDRFGDHYSLALVSPDGGPLREVATYRDADNINPRWSADGRQLYFISNHGGIPNLHRTGLSGDPGPVTDLFTGVSGLTELSPALDVADGTGRLVFTLYRGGSHELWRIDQARILAAGVASGRADDLALLPPERRRDGALLAMLTGQPEALADGDAFATRDYDADLSLDYISPPSLGFAVSSAGSFIGGGVALYFSDMLGFYELGTQLQVQVVNGNVLNGIGAQATYISRRNRAHWGLTGGQIPQITQAFGQGLVDTDGDGDAELVQQTLRFWTVSRQAIGLLQYPFSEFRRVEFSAGFEHISFDAETEALVFDLPGGQLIQDVTMEAAACGDSLSIRRDLCRPSSLNQISTAAALVFDNSVASYTGPIQGARYRMEVAPSFGSLTYISVLGDWRWYGRLASPLTLAGRLLHFGRWAGDAEDERLRRLFLGYPSLIRGYGNGSFEVSNCPAGQPAEQCSEIQVFDQLFGSRLAVANAELRLSLFGPVGVIGRDFFIPVDLIGFFDTGVAWTDDDPQTPAFDERASFLGGDRDPLRAAGVGLRFNLLGFALAEVHWVKPFDRPDKGGYFSFSLNTGY